MDRLSILAMAAEAVQKSETISYGQAFHTAPFSIRKGLYTDIPYLEAVERSAAELFQGAGLDLLVDGPTIDPSLLAAMVAANSLWIAVSTRGEPIGFLGGQGIGDNFHVVELSVARAYQGRGIGGALMRQMLEEVMQTEYRALTLTTFRDLPWNGPWYARLGFSEVDVKEMGGEYLRIWQAEAMHGFDPSTRVVMRKVI